MMHKYTVIKFEPNANIGAEFFKKLKHLQESKLFRTQLEAEHYKAEQQIAFPDNIFLIRQYDVAQEGEAEYPIDHRYLIAPQPWG